jgi:hypothetical protein
VEDAGWKTPPPELPKIVGAFIIQNRSPFTSLFSVAISPSVGSGSCPSGQPTA